MTTLEPLVFTFIVLAAAVVLARVVRNRDAEERTLLWAAFIAHTVAVVAHVLVTDLYFGGGDATEYMHMGSAFAELLRYDPETFLPPVLQTLFQVGEPEFPFVVWGIGHSTGSMHAIVSFLALLTGDGMYASSLIVSLLTFAASGLLYFTFKPYFPAAAHQRLGMAVLLIPTTVFWNSGLLKEPMAVLGLAPALYGFERITQGRVTRGLMSLVPGLWIIGLFKPYILFPCAVGMGLWFFVKRAAAKETQAPIRPIYFFAGSLLALGALVVLGRIFPKFAIERIAETTAHQQQMGDLVRGGSYYSMGDSEQRSIAGQLVYAPFALLTALFRPLIFEARSAAALVNAVETTILTLLAVRTIMATSWAWAWRTIMSNPVLVFCLSFVIIMATAVGLSTTNFGTLSRYRSPFVPFLATLILTVSAQVHARAALDRVAFNARRATGRPAQE